MWGVRLNIYHIYSSQYVHPIGSDWPLWAAGECFKFPGTWQVSFQVFSFIWILEERLMICLFHDLLNFVSFPHPHYWHAEKIQCWKFLHWKIEDLLRVKCRLSNYENSSTFETVLYSYPSNKNPFYYITLSDVTTLYIKGYRRKNWSHGWKCTVSCNATPYTFGQGNQKIHFFHFGSHVFDHMTLISLINQ